MLSIEKLNEYGADIKTGVERCMGSEDFYLQMVKMIPQEPNFIHLNEAIARNDLKGAFEAAHALKGVAGNLSLSPLFAVVSEITELLRAGTEMDYTEYLRAINQQKELLEKLIREE